MHGVNWTDAAVRAAKTFIQAAVPLAVSVPALVASGNFAAVPAVLAAAGLAGAAAVIAFGWNVLLDWSR